jgi:hypothetical protein
MTRDQDLDPAAKTSSELRGEAPQRHGGRLCRIAMATFGADQDASPGVAEQEANAHDARQADRARDIPNARSKIQPRAQAAANPAPAILTTESCFVLPPAAPGALPRSPATASIQCPD